MKFKLVIGIPSYNEESTISNVVANIDNALLFLDDNVNVQIVNSDNHSSDSTRQSFLNTPTKHEKIFLNTFSKGKGANLKNILNYSVANNFDGVIFMDSDLDYVAEKWITELTKKLISGYDAVFTRRIPRWNNGDLTYHLAFPVLNLFWNTNIHEPISGDFGFSNKFMKQALSQVWDNNILGYGVDFFFTSIASRLNWCEIILDGTKEHKLRSYNRNSHGFITMHPKFKEVILTVKDLVSKNINAPKHHVNNNYFETVFGNSEWQLASAPNYDFDIEELKVSVKNKYLQEKNSFDEMFKNCEDYFNQNPFTGITNEFWCKNLLAFILSSNNSEIEKNVDLLENIFFCRVIGFYHEIKGKQDWYSLVEKNSNDLKRQLSEYKKVNRTQKS